MRTERTEPGFSFTSVISIKHNDLQVGKVENQEEDLKIKMMK